MKKETLSHTNIFFINVTGLTFVFIVLKELQEIFIPLILAFFLFFVFSPFNNFLRKKKFPVVLILSCDLLILLLVFSGISGVLIDSFSRLGDQLPIYIDKLNKIISGTARSWGIKNSDFINFDLKKSLNQIDYMPLASNLFNSTFSMLGTLFFVVFFFIFVITGYSKAYEAVKNRYLEKHLEYHYESRQFQNEKNEKIKLKKMNSFINEKEGYFEKSFNEITEQIQSYIVVKFLISLLSGVITGIILWLFGVDFYLVWAVITFILNFIPNLGSLISIILPGIMSLIQFDSIGYSIIIVLVLSAVDIVSGFYLEPKAMDNSLRLNPLVLLLSLLLWGYIWGIVGIILSVPLTALLKIIISRSESPNLQFISDLISGEE